MSTDLEREIRELLAERADAVRSRAEAPAPMLRRARRRRAGTALGSAVVALGLVAAAVVGTRALIAPTAAPQETRLGGSNAEPFAVWPQQTREDAEAAQRCADDMNAECLWQLNALEVVRRYGEQELGWRHVYVLVPGFNDEFIRLPVGESEEIGLVDEVQPLTMYIAECPAGETAVDRCPIVEMRVEKPLRPDVTGIWLITSSSGEASSAQFPGELEGPTPMPPMPPALGEFLHAFMEARIRGEEVAPFLTEPSYDDLDWYEGVSTRTPYHFTGWSRKRATDGWADRFIVYVRIFGRDGARSERLEVQGGAGERTVYAITAAASEA